MTILDLIKAACKTKGVPEKYAERIQKTFKIEKAEGMEAFVDLFKENILPAIQEAENEAKTTAETAAVAAYEAKHGLKDGKPVEDPEKNKKTEEELFFWEEKLKLAKRDIRLRERAERILSLLPREQNITSELESEIRSLLEDIR